MRSFSVRPIHWWTMRMPGALPPAALTFSGSNARNPSSGTSPSRYSTARSWIAARAAAGARAARMARGREGMDVGHGRSPVHLEARPASVESTRADAGEWYGRRPGDQGAAQGRAPPRRPRPPRPGRPPRGRGGGSLDFPPRAGEGWGQEAPPARSRRPGIITRREEDPPRRPPRLPLPPAPRRAPRGAPGLRRRPPRSRRGARRLRTATRSRSPSPSTATPPSPAGRPRAT